jgi:hypothetical protein
MKRSTWLIMIFALFLVGSMILVEQTSAAEKINLTATDTFDPFGLGGPVVGEILDPGTVTCPGFEPTGNPEDPCPAGSRINTRGFTIITRIVADTDLVTGNATIVVNANFDAFGTGPAWGTITIDIDAGGAWEGTWEGIRVMEGYVWVLPVHASFQGTGGLVDGMRYRNVDTIYSNTPVVVAYEGYIEGIIIDPHSE